MPTLTRRTLAAALILAATLPACGSSHHRSNAGSSSPPGPSPSAAGSSTPSPVPTKLAFPAAPPGAAVPASTFGMHILQLGARPWPKLPIGAVRLWDNDVRWADLQPSGQSWDPTALKRLDTLVNTARSHGADPLLVLGMTPTWAARSCQHVAQGTDWGVATCSPAATGMSSPWATYVRFLAKRYKGKVHAYETWNEPNLRNGWNDSPARLAQLQATARSVLRSVDPGIRLLSPSIAITCCDPVGWLDNYLGQPGGTSFDVVGIHLYPAPHQVPEWSMSMLAQVRAVLAKHGVHDPVWDTELNVGRKIANETYGGSLGAALLARALIIGTASGVSRSFWYAAYDHVWSGIELEGANYRTLTPAGSAYGTVRGWLVGSRVTPCTTASTSGYDVVQCGVVRADGSKGLIAWTTAGSLSLSLPAGAKSIQPLAGAARPASGQIQLSVQPQLVRL